MLKPCIKQSYYWELGILLLIVLTGCYDVYASYPVLDDFALLEISLSSLALSRMVFIGHHIHQQYEFARALAENDFMQSQIKEVITDINETTLAQKAEHMLNDPNEKIILKTFANHVIKAANSDIRVRVNLLDKAFNVLRYDVVDVTFKGEVLPIHTNVNRLVFTDKEVFTSNDNLEVNSAYKNFLNETINSIFGSLIDSDVDIWNGTLHLNFKLDEDDEVKHFSWNAEETEILVYEKRMEKREEYPPIDYYQIKRLFRELEKEINASSTDGSMLEFNWQLIDVHEETKEEDSKEA